MSHGLGGSGGVAVLLLLAAAGAATAAAYTPTKDANSGQLSPSVLLMGEFDWALSTGGDGKPWSRCLDMVWRARSVSKGNKLNFVPTHHWLPRDDGFGVSQYCYLHTSGGSDRGTCMSWTPGKLAEFKKSMTLCLAETIRQGFIPYVRPHLDDGLNRWGVGSWTFEITASACSRKGQVPNMQQGCSCVSLSLVCCWVALVCLQRLAAAGDWLKLLP